MSEKTVNPTLQERQIIFTEAAVAGGGVLQRHIGDFGESALGDPKDWP